MLEYKDSKSVPPPFNLLMLFWRCISTLRGWHQPVFTNGFKLTLSSEQQHLLEHQEIDALTHAYAKAERRSGTSSERDTISGPPSAAEEERLYEEQDKFARQVRGLVLAAIKKELQPIQRKLGVANQPPSPLLRSTKHGAEEAEEMLAALLPYQDRSLEPPPSQRGNKGRPSPLIGASNTQNGASRTGSPLAEGSSANSSPINRYLSDVILDC